MGYYTDYSLSTFVYNEKKKKLVETAQPAEISAFLLRRETNDEDYSLPCQGVLEEPCKWYDYEKGMKKFIKMFPQYVFLLEGCGEEKDDHWYKYYMNGKVQDVTPKKPSILPFDKKKLK